MKVKVVFPTFTFTFRPHASYHNPKVRLRESDNLWNFKCFEKKLMCFWNNMFNLNTKEHVYTFKSNQQHLQNPTNPNHTLPILDIKTRPRIAILIQQYINMVTIHSSYTQNDLQFDIYVLCSPKTCTRKSPVWWCSQLHILSNPMLSDWRKHFYHAQNTYASNKFSKKWK